MSSSVQPPLLLVIEDEEAVRAMLVASLSAHGYRLLEAASGREGLRHARAYVPDLVLLDLRLPDMDGVEVAQRLRTWSQAPIVVLSSRGLETDKVAALDAGADDYVTKPFGFQELLARLRVALRRAARLARNGMETVFSAGALRVDLERRRVQVGGRDIRLTPTEFKLLTVLVRHAGCVVTHRTLLEQVWGPASPKDNQYVRVYMTHLRRKLEADPLHPTLFETDAGVGYRLRVDDA